MFWAIFVYFLEKATPYGKTFKILFRKFLPPHRSKLLCSNVVNLSDGKSVKSCVIYLTPKNSAASQTVATARIASKICQGQPPTMCSQCSSFHPNRFTFGGVISERVNIVFCPVEYFYDFARRYASLRRANNNLCMSIYWRRRRRRKRSKSARRLWAYKSRGPMKPTGATASRAALVNNSAHLDNNEWWRDDGDGVQYSTLVVIVVFRRHSDGLTQSHRLVACVLRRDRTSPLVNTRPPQTQTTRTHRQWRPTRYGFSRQSQD